MATLRAPRSKESKKGITWFFNEIRRSAKDFHHNTFNPVNDPFIGGMFFFLYSPKYKDKLPYYDKFPLVIPFGVEPGTFIGLNLHYAPSSDRIRILQYLDRVRAKKSTREYATISYQTLKVAVKADVYKPCIHRYLTSHLRSRLVKVNMNEWENIAALPVAQWRKGGGK
jgi:hypothetical protein